MHRTYNELQYQPTYIICQHAIESVLYLTQVAG